MHESTSAPRQAPSLGRRHAPVVYYLGTEYGGAVKIGTTVNLAARLRRFQAERTVNYRVLALEAGDATLERQRHREHHGARVAGEWYWLTPELEAHIAGLGDCAKFIKWALEGQEAGK